MEIEIFSWRDFKRPSFQFNLHPLMLTSLGYVTLAKMPVKSDATWHDLEMRRFRFDRDYVIQYLISKIIIRLAITDVQQLQTLIEEAWNAHQELEKAD